MKTNLSSQITLTRIPLRYYRPENAFEHSVLTRLEKIPTNIYESAEEGSFAIAKEIATQIRKKQDIGKPFVIALPGGRSPLSVYKELIRMHKEEKLSFRNVIAFVEYEFYPLANPSAGNLARLKEELFDQVDIDPANIYCPDGSMPKDAILDFCRQYEETIQSVGGIDCMLLGIGNSSNIMFNVGGTTISSRTRMVLLEGASRKEAARTFPSQENVPAGIITMGISTMMNARSVILMAWGEDKASIVAKTVEGKVSDAVPSSYLQNHPNAKVVIDLSAAYDLTRISHPWLVTSCEWDNKLIRRAIVWLCQLTDKPILKLTNKDYSEHGLGELLALYGSAYNVNIKIFNDIQHTITGWPGGKPNADDSNRPERANPYPKKVIVFSPHPDDDVISMGGTFIRLIAQGHDVHVAYQTSGNIAVLDDIVLQTLDTARECGFVDRYNEVQEIINNKKKGEAEPIELRRLKGSIRRAEAKAACRQMGLTDPSHVHFLNLPFYETGGVKKGLLTDKDIQIVVDLLREIKPHQIYAAGDLSDPHGTHRVCIEAVLAAMEVVQDEEWVKECRLWLYRGAWQEWDLDMVDMAVPLSPDEVIQKRHAIYRHLSQKDIVPFPGEDKREFWQRAEERNQNTARLYDKLGMAEYQAIEVFVRLF